MKRRGRGIITVVALVAVVIVLSAGGAFAMGALTPEQNFLYGKTKDCPNCKLSQAALNGRDLSNANLKGATWIDYSKCEYGSIGKCNIKK